MGPGAAPGLHGARLRWQHPAARRAPRGTSPARPGARPAASSGGSGRPRGRGRPAGGQSRPGGGQRRRADPARRTAYDVLIAVDQRDAYANLLLPSLLGQRGLAGRDAALATELTYGTLRGRGTYDAILGLCSDRALDRVDPPLREVLRLGTHQLLATRVAPHAAVATSVDLARDLAGPRSAGFVNAVLRRVSTRDLESWIGVAAPRAGRGPARAPGGPLQPSALAGGGDRRRPGRGRGGPAPRDRGRAGRGRRPAAGHPVHGARAGRPLGTPGRGRGAGPVVGVRCLSRRGRPGGHRAGRGGARCRAGRGQPARRRRAGPGRPGRPGHPVARHVRGPGGQSPAAGRPGRPAGRAPAGRRRAAAPRPAGPGRGRGHRRRRGGGGRRRPPGLGARHVRPGPGRRPVLRYRGAAPPPRGTLAEVTRGRAGPRRAAARGCSAAPWTRPGPGEWWPT